ncbi:MAG TPA: hypothetical protein VGV06_08295 [Methylomirabilota bacterium]|nr:hypothetical protein [Methylomirabilota bacterium]
MLENSGRSDVPSAPRMGARWRRAGRLGEDTREAQAVLEEAYLGLDEPGQAWSMARAVRDAAEKAGNQLDLASARAAKVRKGLEGKALFFPSEIQ